MSGAPAGPSGAAVTVEVTAGVARCTIGNGRRRNALDSTGWRRLAAEAGKLASDRDVRAVVLEGSGDSFCSGSDLNEWADAEISEVDASFAAMEEAMQAVEAIPVPVIAAIRGVATGAGFELCLAADVRVCAESARLGMPVGRLGVLLSVPFARRITAVAGPEVALDLLYTGRLLGAPEALERGLVSRVVADPDLDAAVGSLLRRLGKQPAAAARAAKRAVFADRDWAGGEAFDHAVDLPRLREQVARFLGRRGLAS